jgi:ATP-dependent Clp protease adapter protein ClpS
MHRLRQLAILALLALSTSAIAAAKDLAVVVNKANDTKSLTVADLTKLLKDGTKKWPAGQEVVIVLHDPNSPSMRVVLQKVLGMTVEQAKALIATANQGRANAAIVIADTDDVALKMVAANAGAIGLVDVYAINSSVNVVKVDGKMPLEPGYLLHGVW